MVFFYGEIYFIRQLTIFFLKNSFENLYLNSLRTNFTTLKQNRMQKIILFLFIIPFSLNAQFENRTHLNFGNSILLSDTGYHLYDDFVIGGETILGLRLGKFFGGIGIGMQYTGNDYLVIRDSLGNEIGKISAFNIDVPLFLDFTYGKKFYVEGKVGYSVKLSNSQDIQSVNTHTLFNSIGVGYSIPLGEKVFLDLAIEGKFNYLFVNTININYKTIYFLPIAKIGFRFTNTLKN